MVKKKPAKHPESNDRTDSDQDGPPGGLAPNVNEIPVGDCRCIRVVSRLDGEGVGIDREDASDQLNTIGFANADDAIDVHFLNALSGFILGERFG